MTELELNDLHADEARDIKDAVYKEVYQDVCRTMLKDCLDSGMSRTEAEACARREAKKQATAAAEDAVDRFLADVDEVDDDSDEWEDEDDVEDDEDGNDEL